MTSSITYITLISIWKAVIPLSSPATCNMRSWYIRRQSQVSLRACLAWLEFCISSVRVKLIRKTLTAFWLRISSAMQKLQKKTSAFRAHSKLLPQQKLKTAYLPKAWLLLFSREAAQEARLNILNRHKMRRILAMDPVSNYKWKKKEKEKKEKVEP